MQWDDSTTQQEQPQCIYVMVPSQGLPSTGTSYVEQDFGDACYSSNQCDWMGQMQPARQQLQLSQLVTQPPDSSWQQGYPQPQRQAFSVKQQSPPTCQTSTPQWDECQQQWDHPQRLPTNSQLRASEFTTKQAVLIEQTCKSAMKQAALVEEQLKRQHQLSEAGQLQLESSGQYHPLPQESWANHHESSQQFHGVRRAWNDPAPRRAVEDALMNFQGLRGKKDAQYLKEAIAHKIDAGCLDTGQGLHQGVPAAGMWTAGTWNGQAVGGKEINRLPRHPKHSGGESMSTMRGHLQVLRQSNQSCVFSVRKIHKMGLSSPSILRSHFAQYGEVKDVLVAHSHVKCAGQSGPNAQRRLRAAGLAFVVMDSEEAVANILADGPEHNVRGYIVFTEPFFLRADVDDNEECDDILCDPKELEAEPTPSLRNDDGCTVPPTEEPDATKNKGTMRGHLQALRQEDPSCVFSVRGLQKLGWMAPDALKTYFGSFGKVKDVLVSSSRVRLGRDPNFPLRQKSVSGLGFIVMYSADDVAGILAEGLEHCVCGVIVQITPFYLGGNDDNMIEDDVGPPCTVDDKPDIVACSPAPLAPRGGARERWHSPGSDHSNSSIDCQTAVPPRPPLPPPKWMQALQQPASAQSQNDTSKTQLWTHFHNLDTFPNFSMCPVCQPGHISKPTFAAGATASCT